MPVAISTSGGAHGVFFAAITLVCETTFDFIWLSRYLRQERGDRAHVGGLWPAYPGDRASPPGGRAARSFVTQNTGGHARMFYWGRRVIAKRSRASRIGERGNG